MRGSICLFSLPWGLWYRNCRALWSIQDTHSPLFPCSLPVIRSSSLPWLSPRLSEKGLEWVWAYLHLASFLLRPGQPVELCLWLTLLSYFEEASLLEVPPVKLSSCTTCRKHLLKNIPIISILTRSVISASVFQGEKNQTFILPMLQSYIITNTTVRSYSVLQMAPCLWLCVGGCVCMAYVGEGHSLEIRTWGRG